MEEVNFIGMNELNIGSYIVHEARACKIMSKKTIQPGKHGDTKAVLILKDIFDGRRYDTTHISSEKVDVPVVKKNNFTARSILNGIKINLYIFLVFYVICWIFHILLLIFFYHMHYKNNFHNVFS